MRRAYSCIKVCSKMVADYGSNKVRECPALNLITQVESQRDKLTETLVETKKSLEDRTNVLKEDLRQVVTRSERAQTMKLLNLQLYDLHMNEEATKTAARYLLTF